MKSRLLAALVVPVTLLTGCGDHPRAMDTHALEVKITHDMSRSNRNVHVTCPAQVSIHAGEVFKCSFRETGGSGVIEVKILDTSGRTHWAVVTHG